MNRPDIDWQAVLGPLFGTDIIPSHEIQELENATRTHVRRALRMRSNDAPHHLPFATEAVPWYEPGRFLVDSTVRPGAFLQYASGGYYIQDAGSMLALALCDARPGQLICDVCAAPGGKSTGLLDRLGGAGLVLANEVIHSRVGILELALARSGFDNYLIHSLETESLARVCGDVFDCVLVDAPCTGQSMIGKGKQSLSAFSARQIEHSAARQQRIVRNAAALVRLGGRLVYSTCTFAHAENEGILQWLCELSNDWQPIIEPKLNHWASYLPGTYRLWPHRDQCAGAFAAAYRRIGNHDVLLDDQAVAGRRHVPFDARKKANWVEADFPAADYWSERVAGQWFRRGDQIHRFQQATPHDWIELAVAGVEVAKIQSRDTVPSFPSAVAGANFLSGVHFCELDDHDASRFMAGESLMSGELADGWTVACWRSHPLAWTKFVCGTLKNHLPKPLRQPGLRASM